MTSFEVVAYETKPQDRASGRIFNPRTAKIYSSTSCRTLEIAQKHASKLMNLEHVCFVSVQEFK